MGDEVVNVDDLLNELLEAFELRPEPKASEGWFTVEDMMSATNQTEDAVRSHADKAVKEKRAIKVLWNRRAYYKLRERPARDENNLRPDDDDRFCES